jgi:hypothetical protein
MKKAFNRTQDTHSRYRIQFGSKPTKAKDTERGEVTMPEEKESIYDKIRREAKEKQAAELERRARVREVMEKGNTPSWLQRLNK